MSTARDVSRAWKPLMKMPSWAPRPEATKSAVGVARPRAHGQAMMRTARAGAEGLLGRAARRQPAAEGDRPRWPARPGRRPPQMRSASRWTAAFSFWASSTRRTIWASWVSRPTPVARRRSGRRGRSCRRPPRRPGPPRPAGTRRSWCSGRRGLAGDDPPSVATFSPGRTTNASPTASSSGGQAAFGAVRARGPTPPWPPPPPASAGRRPVRRLGHGLEVPAGQQEGGHPGRHVEVDGAARWADEHGEPATRPGRRVPANMDVERPGGGGDDAHRDQGVHGGGAVAGGPQGGAVEGPGRTTGPPGRPGPRPATASSGTAARGRA